MDLGQFIIQNFNEFLTYTAFANATVGNLIMIAVGAFFIWLAIKKDFEPLLLVPIGLGIILGNIPFRADAGLEIGLYEDNSVLNIFYQGVRQGWYPPLIFLGIGAMTDFTALQAHAHRCSCPVWHLRCLHGGIGLRLRAFAGRRYRYHRWR